MSYNKVVYQQLRSLEVPRHTALALADDTNPLGFALPAAAVADVAALTSTAAATNPPTKVEFDKVVADLVAIRTTVNALTASLRSAGIIASS